MIRIKQKGDYSKTTHWLEGIKAGVKMSVFDKYGRKGVEALRNATPKDTGLTADSWEYEVIQTKSGFVLQFNNTNFNDWCPIAIILQYGHATRNGGWVEGRDYINPAIQPIFDDIADELWKEVEKS